MSKKEGREVVIIAVLADGRMGGRAMQFKQHKSLLFATELFYIFCHQVPHYTKILYMPLSYLNVTTSRVFKKG
jgi:hypothetical protein